MIHDEDILIRLKDSLKSLFKQFRVGQRWREHFNNLMKELENDQEDVDNIIKEAFENIPDESRERVANAHTLEDLKNSYNNKEQLDKIENRINRIPVKKIEMRVAHKYPGYRGSKDFIPKDVVMGILAEFRSDIE